MKCGKPKVMGAGTDQMAGKPEGGTAFEKGEVRVYNLLGEIIFNEELKNVAAGFSMPIHLEHSQPGIYFIKLRTELGDYTEKFIAQ